MTAEHWDQAYAQGDTTRSWYQPAAALSLELLDRFGVTADQSVIDVGGGGSPLVDALLERGHRVCVLDVSVAALDIARNRLGPAAEQVDWVLCDVLDWQPPRAFDVWHDRAAFHFLTDPDDQAHYRDVLRAATAPGALAVLATFAPDGPTACSGLPVARWDAAELAAQFAADWTPVHTRRVVHHTPAGVAQPFTWVALRRT